MDEDGRRKKYFCAKIEVETIEEKDIGSRGVRSVRLARYVELKKREEREGQARERKTKERGKQMNERAKLRKTRITVAAILSAAGLALIAAGAGKIAGKEAKAEEIRIVEGSGEAGAFEMLEGASVRLNVEDGEYGIRFGARVSDREREYGFMVVPDELAERYNEVEREITLSEYCEEEAKKAGGKPAKAEGLQADEEGKIYLSLVDVLWENLNRGFTGIAYYTEEGSGKRIEASGAGKSERSIKEVAERAVASGNLNKEEREAAERLVKDGAKQANGIAIDSSLGERFHEEREEVGNEEASEDAGSGADGEGWHINGGKKITARLNEETIERRLREADGVVSFRMKGLYGGSVTFYNRDGSAGRAVRLSAGEYEEIMMPGKEFRGYEKVVFAGETGEDGRTRYYISEVREESAEEAGKRIEAEIVELEVSTIGTEEEKEEIRKRIAEAEEKYGNLSDKAKEYVANYARLEELKKALEGEEETEEVIYSAKDNPTLLQVTGTTQDGAKIKAEKVKIGGEEKKVWSLVREQFAARTGFEFTPEKGEVSIDEATAIYDEIILEIYIEGKFSSEKTLEVAFTIGEYDKKADVSTYKKYKIESGKWTRIRMTREDFLKYYRMTLLVAIESSEVIFRIGDVIGVKR